MISQDAIAIDGDPFADDTPLACGLENPDACEACS